MNKECENRLEEIGNWREEMKKYPKIIYLNRDGIQGERIVMVWDNHEKSPRVVFEISTKDATGTEAWIDSSNDMIIRRIMMNAIKDMGAKQIEQEQAKHV